MGSTPTFSAPFKVAQSSFSSHSPQDPIKTYTSGRALFTTQVLLEYQTPEYRFFPVRAPSNLRALRESHNTTIVPEGKSIFMARSKEGTTTLQVRNFPPELLQRINGIAEFAGVDRDALVAYWLEEITKEHKPLQDKLTKQYDLLPRAKVKR